MENTNGALQNENKNLEEQNKKLIMALESVKKYLNGPSKLIFFIFWKSLKYEVIFVLLDFICFFFKVLEKTNSALSANEDLKKKITN